MKLEDLSRQAENCERCRLSKSRTQVLFGEGNPNAKIVFIGEAPGRNEDKTGRVFVGQAGKILDKMLSSIDLERKNLYITNVVKCRPPQNRTPLDDEIKSCDFWMRRQLDIINPQIIVFLGKTALRKYLPNERIGSMHGNWERVDDTVYFFTYHPAVALYTRNFENILMEDMKKLEKIIRNEGLK